MLVRAALRRTGRAQVFVTGTSMLPTIQPGTRVTITARPFEAVRTGDVVAFALGPDIFVHRVVDRDRNRLVTLGDNMPLLDPPVHAQAFLGHGEGIADPVARPVGGDIPATDLTDTTIWCPRPPSDRSPVQRLAVLGATVRTADPHAFGPTAAPRGGRIAVSGFGAGTVSQIPALMRAVDGPCHLLVGYRFGRPEDTGCLPPDVADHHVRPAAPLREVSLEAALNTIAGVFGGGRVSDGLVSAR
ncbi:hypothetical protein GCM10009558_036260 [Virgisporangium aurantiacum]